MNLLKPAFVIAFVVWLCFAGVFALVQIAVGTEPTASWLGLALSAFTPLAYLISVFVFRLSRNERPSLVYSILTGLGLAVTMAMSWRYDQAAGYAHIWAGISLA